MGWRNREVEVKMLVSGVSFSAASKKVKEYVEKTYSEMTEISGKSSDTYWITPKQSEASFLRLRKNPHGLSQITVKAQDKGDNVDRVEIDLEVTDYDQAKALLEYALGPQKRVVTKRYDVYFLENEHTNFSVYTVSGDDKVFIEVEARSIKRLRDLIKGFAEFSGYEMQKVGSSIYDMYVAEKKMKVSDIKTFLEEDSK